MLKLLTLRFAAIYQIVSAGAFALSVVGVTEGGTKILSIIAIILCLLNGVFGIALLRNYRWAQYASFLNFLFQIPIVISTPFSYKYTGVADAYLAVLINYKEGTFLIGPGAFFTPGTFFFFIGAPQGGVEVYLGGLAIMLTVILARSIVQAKH